MKIDQSNEHQTINCTNDISFQNMFCDFFHFCFGENLAKIDGGIDIHTPEVSSNIPIASPSPKHSQFLNLVTLVSKLVSKQSRSKPL